jgi:hypothetical protein
VLGALAVAIAIAACGAAGPPDQELVIVRETRTLAGVPMGSTVKITTRVFEARIREDMVAIMDSATFSEMPMGAPPGDGAKREEFLSSSAVWFPEDARWRSWSPKDSVFDESTEEQMASPSDSGSLDFFRAMFGGKETLTKEFTFTVDSLGAPKTILGHEARRRVHTVAARIYDLETDSTIAFRIVEELWMTARIPGMEEAEPRVLHGPGVAAERAMQEFALIALTVVREGFDRLRGESAKLPGFPLVRELRLESDRSPEASVLSRTEVLEIRDEAYSPEHFALPKGLKLRARSSNRPSR